MIKVSNSSLQEIDINSTAEKQKIVVSNVEEQSVIIREQSEIIDIQIVNADVPQKIIIGSAGEGSGSGDCDLESRVPKDLTVLPPTQIQQFATPSARKSSRIYVDIDGKPSYATMEQIKELNTKTILINSLADTKIGSLSEGDFALLEER